MVSVGGQPSGRIRETKVIQVQNAELVTPGQACQIQLKIPGYTVFSVIHLPTCQNKKNGDVQKLFM
jgi:hypothetical protein